MLAGGIGYGKADQALKDIPKTGDKVVILRWRKLPYRNGWCSCIIGRYRRILIQE